MTTIAITSHRSARLPKVAALLGALLVLALVVWQALAVSGSPDPTTPHTSATVATLDIAVLVFREGLECVLVLSAITAGMNGSQSSFRRPIGVGAVAGFVATLISWFVAVRAVDALSGSIPALDIQAASGLLAIVVLLVVMNWFFHRIYWTGWITMHNRKKRSLLAFAGDDGPASGRVLWGLGLLGFTSLYREGFEVVLFLQSYRLQLGGHVVLVGALAGGLLAAVIAVLTFVARRRLPYKQMLVVTGVLLAIVLLVMVGEQAQEMQLANWIPTTPVHALEGRIPAWIGLWLSVFPTRETMVSQLVAALLVFGSYAVARARTLRASTRSSVEHSLNNT